MDIGGLTAVPTFLRAFARRGIGRLLKYQLRPILVERKNSGWPTGTSLNPINTNLTFDFLRRRGSEAAGFEEINEASVLS